MKQFITWSAILALMGMGCGQPPCGNQRCSMIRASRQNQVLRHVVLFSFKEGTTPEQIRQVEDAFRALPGKINAILDFEWGTNNSPENLAQGYTHCFFLSFKDEAARAAYLPHPDHKAFGQTLGPILEKVCVVDYWAQQ